MKRDIYNGDKRVRFLLGQSGYRKLFVLGLNPSKADAEQSDQTIRKIKGFVERQKDFDGFVMLNLCPLRFTDPNALPKQENEELKHLTNRNWEVIQEILETEITPTIWAAWGANIKSRSYLFRYLQTIAAAAANRNSDWKIFGGLTKDGHPRHPSRLSYRNELGTFDIEKYLCAFASLR